MKGNGGRAAFSLAEVLVAIIIIAVALAALLEVFFATLRLTTESARNSRGLMAAQTQVQKSFFEDKDLKDVEGVNAVPLTGVFFNLSAGADAVSIAIGRYDVGDESPLRVYRKAP